MVFVKTDDGIDIFVLPESALCELAQENPLYMNDLPDGCPMKDSAWACVCKPSYCNYYGE